MVLQSLWMINSTISKIRQMSKLYRSERRYVFIYLFILKGIFHTIAESTHLYIHTLYRCPHKIHISQFFYLQQGYNILLCLDRNRCYKIYICNPQSLVFLQQQLLYATYKINFYCENEILYERLKWDEESFNIIKNRLLLS